MLQCFQFNNKHRSAQMRKIIFAILGILLACQQGIQGPQFDSTGTEGVVVRINPASTQDFLMCQESNMLLDLNNIGLADVPQGIFTVITEDQIISTTKKQGSFALDGRSPVNPEGGATQLSFRLKSKTLPPQLETYQTPFIFHACYPYNTYASIPVCIDPDVNNRQDKSCISTPVSGKGGQGAPVAVTLVEPKITIEDNTVIPTFIISIANVGRGRVVAPELLGGCGAGTEKSTIRAFVQLQDETLKCAPEAIDLRAGETKITCRSNKNFGTNQGTFTTPLSIHLEYGYTTTSFLPLTITRLPQQKQC